MDGGAAGVSRGGADNVEAFAALRQYLLEQVSEELQRHILEGQRDAMEQLEDIDAILLHQRRHLRMGEGGVRTVDQPLQDTRRDVTHEGRDDLESQLRVGQAAP